MLNDTHDEYASLFLKSALILFFSSSFCASVKSVLWVIVKSKLFKNPGCFVSASSIITSKLCANFFVVKQGGNSLAKYPFSIKLILFISQDILQLALIRVQVQFSFKRLIQNGWPQRGQFLPQRVDLHLQAIRIGDNAPLFVERRKFNWQECKPLAVHICIIFIHYPRADAERKKLLEGLSP